VIRLCSVIGILLLTASRVSAGAVPTDLRGSLVRVTPLSGARIIGTLTDVGDVSLTVTSDKGVETIRRDSVRKLEWRDRHGHRSVISGALATGALTGLIGLLISPKSWGTDETTGERFCTTRWDCAGKAAAGGALIGTIGAFATHAEVWRKVPLDKVSATIQPMRRGMTAGLTIAW